MPLGSNPTLFECIHQCPCIVDASDNYATYSLSSQVLTRSALFKLSRKAVMCIVSSSDDDDDDNMAKSYATRACVSITEKLLHPTMDAACESPLLLAILVEEKRPRRQSNYDVVLMAMTTLIHRLMIHRKGNQKTTHQLLSNGQVLIALSRLHYYFCARETVDTEVGLLPISKIFAFGVFHSTHLLQGFYSRLHKIRSVKSAVAFIVTNI